MQRSPGTSADGGARAGILAASAAPRLGPVASLRRRLRGLHLGVLDLLEDLAHPRAHQVARLRVDISISPADPGRLAGIDGFVGETIVVGHGPDRDGGWPLRQPGSARLSA
jgi:hypothetical protein